MMLLADLTIESEHGNRENKLEINVEFTSEDDAYNVVQKIKDLLMKTDGEIKYHATSDKTVWMVGGIVQ